MATDLKKNPISLFSLIVLVLLTSSLKIKDPQSNILSWDVFGFYLYLPATFIYDDPSIKDISWVENTVATYNNTATLYQLAPTGDGRNVIRFSPGMSIMMSPFFLAGHAIAGMGTSPADGFSKPYQWAIIFAGMFYFIIGLIFLRKILLRYLSDRATAISLAVLVVSSNLYFFVTYGNDIPHVYAFTLNVLIIWLTIRWHEEHKKVHAVLLGVLLGLAVISRISEVLMVLVPLLWGVYNRQSLNEKIKLLLKYREHVFFLALAGFLAIAPQLLYWKAASGSWFFWAYTDAGSSLNLLNPRFAWVLFSFRKGLFIYSPVMILSIIGFYHLYKKNKGIFWAILSVVVFHTYLVASFTSLVAYGWRAFIELYALLAIPLAFLIGAVERSKWVIRIPFYLLVIAFTVLNIFQVWQMNRGILDGYRMTKDYYWRVFGSSTVTPEDRKYMLVERPVTAEESLTNEEDFDKTVLIENGFETPQPGEEIYYDTSCYYSGKMAFRMDSTREFSPTFRKAFNELSDSYYGWARVGVWVYPAANPVKNEIILVIAMRHGSTNYKYKKFSIMDDTLNLKINDWNYLSADYITPELLSRSDKLEVYVWYRGKEPIWIDDLKIEFFDPKY